MIIGFLSIEAFLPYSRSLKEKRQVLSSFKDRIKKRYNVALAEIDFQDKWQRTKIGMITLNSQKTIVEQILQKILADAEQNLGGEILHSEIHYF